MMVTQLKILNLVQAALYKLKELEHEFNLKFAQFILVHTQIQEF